MLIGFIGTKGSGKSTASTYLTSKYGFIENSFAAPLKKACQCLFLLTNEQVNGTLSQKETPDTRWFGCSPRQLLQFVGTDLLRNNLHKLMPELGSDIFIHHFRLWFQEQVAFNPNVKIVISDVRFQNELDFIHELGGTVVKIERGNEIVDTHVSESGICGLDGYDLLLDNNGDYDDLYKKLDSCVGYMDH